MESVTLLSRDRPHAIVGDENVRSGGFVDLQRVNVLQDLSVAYQFAVRLIEYGHSEIVQGCGYF